MPAEHIHSPWNMSADCQRESGCVVGEGGSYPRPICEGLEGPGAAEVRARAEAARAKAARVAEANQKGRRGGAAPGGGGGRSGGGPRHPEAGGRHEERSRGE